MSKGISGNLLQYSCLENAMNSGDWRATAQWGHKKSDTTEWLSGRTDAEAEAPILWSPGGKSQLSGKDPGARKDWGQEQKGATEVRLLDGIIDSMDMNLSDLLQTVQDREAWHATVHGVTKGRTQLT